MKLEVVRGPSGRKRYSEPTAPVLEREVLADRAGEREALLMGNVRSVEEAVDSGDWDDELLNLLADEQAGKSRKGAIEAIIDRQVYLTEDLDDA